ncbi:Hypothetical predicted protein [Octopus vulgaris]|uniref:EF-hand calcium-binding domain-containing protein 5-like n=2 Tax=Octopus vulgaris TaxID=6645 RepID=A0AA36BUH9_OCTVU|nr:Hypothetical predicted protein [Octopus vulgaris]
MSDSFDEHRNSTFTLEEDNLPLQKLIKQKKEENVEETAIKDYISKMASEIPDHIFHYDWFQEEEDLSVQFIAIAEKLLPTLILGVEKLLREVEKKGLTEDKNVCPNFNPLNFLAQFMLRNHPRNLSVSERSAYIKMLQHVTKKINKQFSSEKKKSLMTMKEQIHQRRLKREATKARCREERLKHKAMLVAHFDQWINPENPELRLSSVVKALNTLDEMISEPIDEYESMLKDFKIIEADKTFDEESFSEFLLDYLDHSPVTFDTLLEHLNKSAEANLDLINDEQERKVGSLDRLQVLSILEEFWLLCPDKMRQDLNNPTIWPVTEVEETGIIVGEPSKETTTDSFVVSDGEARGTEEEDEEEQDSTEDKSETDEYSDNASKYEDEDDVNKTGEPSEVDSVTRDAENVGGAENASTAEDAVAGDEEDAPAEDTAAVTEDANAEDDLDDDEAEEEVEEDDEGVRVRKSLLEYSSEFTSTGAEYSFATSKMEDDNYQLVSWIKRVFEVIDEVTKSQENLWQEKLAASILKLEESKDSADNIKSVVSFVEEVTVYRDEDVVTERIAAEDGADKLPQRQIDFSPSAFDLNALTALQFVQLLKSFLTEQHSTTMFDILVGCFHENYQESPDEKMRRLRKIKQDLQYKKLKAISDSLFEMWDVDQSGHVSMKYIENVITNLRKTTETELVEMIEEELDKVKKREKISKHELRRFILNLGNRMPNNYNTFIDCASNMQMSRSEINRGSLRKEWYHKIVYTGRTSGIDMVPVYDIVIKTLGKDAEVHGTGKAVSSYIALLTCEEPSGETFLKYVATSADQAEYLENKILRRDMTCVSFMCIDRGVPVHVPKVKSHGKVFFWNTDEKNNGSLLLIPVKNKKHKVFGLLGIDTLHCPCETAVFVNHEIKYYQGIARAFSIAYHCTKMRQWMITVLESGIRWMQRYCFYIGEVTTYIVEPVFKRKDLNLKPIMSINSDGVTTVFNNPNILRRKASLFKDYLFHCMDCSMTVTATSYDEHHIAYPIRGVDGKVYLIMDIIAKRLIARLPNYQLNELLRILRLLQTAYKEIWNELWDSEQPITFLAAEKKKDDEALRIAVMFDRLLLIDLRQNIISTEESVYDELCNYGRPPETFYCTLKAVISIFYPQYAIMEDYKDWILLKGFINSELHEKIDEFDPTAEEFDGDSVKKYLEDILPGNAMKLGFWPVEYLYFWLHVCVSLREHVKESLHDPADNTEQQPPPE